MIDHDVRPTLATKAPDAHVAAFKFAEHAFAFGDLDLLRFPQREGSDRCAGIFSATVAMTESHVDRIAGGFDFNRAAITTSKMLRHSEHLEVTRDV